MDYALLTGTVLVAGLVLAIVAQWRDWRPPLIVAVLVGVAVRVLIMCTSAVDTWQPVDFVESFKPAGEAVLSGQDPVLASNGGWHFLPTIPYVYGILLWLGIPWEYAGRLVTVVADIVLIPLVAKLAGGPKASLRALQYALNPLAVLIACVHGQVEPVALVFGVAAFVVARGPGDPDRPGMVTDPVVARLRHGVAAHGVAGSIARVLGRGGMLHSALLPGPDDRAQLKRGALAGVLMGLALCAKSWPIWLIPGMLLLLPTLRARDRRAVHDRARAAVLPGHAAGLRRHLAPADPRGHRHHPRHPARSSASGATPRGSPAATGRFVPTWRRSAPT